MPRDWYLKSIDPDGKRPFGEVKLQIVKRAHQYFDLVHSRKTEGEMDLLDALDLYGSFHLIQRQTTWGDFPWGCICLRCQKWTLCEHTSLMASLF